MAREADRQRCARRATAGAAAGLVVLTVPGCLDRPLSPAEPQTSNVVVKQLAQQAPSKIDLLFMIDDSQSMADKQALLASAVPALVRRLVAPRCVDDQGKPLGGSHPCSAGVPEFRPVDDIHVGVLSSSLGGHGSEMCTPSWSAWNPSQDRGAHLIAPHLGWSPASDSDDPSAFIQSFAGQVKAAGDDGCGYEAVLESWYRFLIDPEPPAKIAMKGGVTVAEGVDEVLLGQRRDFLRPDSLLLIVMLSDENDCSIIDDGQAWYVAQQGQDLYRATQSCATDPTSTCCRSCGASEAAPPEGCAPLPADPGCTPKAHDAASDSRNLRCWDQKRRFGVDFLHPVQRYIDGLTQLEVKNRSGQLVKNPLFSAPPGVRARNPSQVLLAGIVGVPWHDVASDDSLTDAASIRYLSARELTQADRWSWLLPVSGAQPADPLMREATVPRTGTHPATGVALVGPDGAGSHPVNGNEWNTGGEDLQYACIYPLEAPRDCAAASGDCDCATAAAADKNPLCRKPGTSEFGTTQYFAKAYPGTRQLEVLRGVGENSIVASICPKFSSGESASPTYGYSPAIESIVERLRDKLLVECMPRPLAIAADGSVQCKVVEALAASGCACDAAKNRQPVASTLADAARRELAGIAECGPDSAGQVPCESLCLCEIGSATDLTSCQNDAKPKGSGWCYVEAARKIGNPALVAGCPETNRQVVRFAGDETPAPGANVVVACLGAALSDGD